MVSWLIHEAAGFNEKGVGGRMSEDKRIAELRGQLFAAQAEHRKAQAALRRAHEIFKDAPPVDGTHALKLALEQQNRALQRVGEMLKKFGNRLQRTEKD